MGSSILVVDDDEAFAEALRDLLRHSGHEVAIAGTCADAVRLLGEREFDLAFVDLRLPDGSGLSVLRYAKATAGSVGVIAVTAYGSVEQAVEAMRLGASGFLIKPVEPEQVNALVDRTLLAGRLDRAVRSESPATAAGEGAYSGILGSSAGVRRLRHFVGLVAGHDANVLLTGESGTGKGLAARAIHEMSPRRSAPLVHVSCAAIPETLVESELFGYEKGAFSGAIGRKPGRFEVASGGTVFLDEIADIPPAVQAKLLRVIQDKEFERLGGNTPIRVDVRIVSATNRVPKDLVESAVLRQDLFFRLNVVAFHLPTLRERREDVPVLAASLLARYADASGKRIRGIAPEALDAMIGHPYPGNVRELENIMQHVAILCPDGETVRLCHLPADLARGAAGPIGESDRPPACAPPAPAADRPATLAEALARAESAAIRATLERAGNRRAEAARLLGISRKSLWERMRRHGISD